MKATCLIVTLLSAHSVKAFRPSVVSVPSLVVPSVLTSSTKPSQQRDVSGAKGSPLFVASADEPTTEWTPKRLHNTAAFRSLALLGALALAGSFSSPRLPVLASACLHVLAFGTWFGSVAYTTFVAGITMFQNLPRQTFGKLQAKLFPKYFALGSVTLLLQLVTLPALPIGIKNASTKALMVALVMTLTNQFYLEPTSTNVMMQRYKMENEGRNDIDTTDEYKQLRASFGKLHGLSSLTNLIALCAGVAHAAYLAKSLVA